MVGLVQKISSKAVSSGLFLKFFYHFFDHENSGLVFYVNIQCLVYLVG